MHRRTFDVHPSIRKRVMRIVVALWGVVVLAGCSGPGETVVAGSEEDAMEVLTAALDAWKAGQQPDSLRDESPPMYVKDVDWKAGRILKAFEAQETPRENGGEWRVKAVLTLEGGGLPEEQKRVAYSVTTETKAVVITRSDNAD